MGSASPAVIAKAAIEIRQHVPREDLGKSEFLITLRVWKGEALAPLLQGLHDSFRASSCPAATGNKLRGARGKQKAGFFL
jgi:hypothetical protein